MPASIRHAAFCAALYGVVLPCCLVRDVLVEAWAWAGERRDG